MIFLILIYNYLNKQIYINNAYLIKKKCFGPNTFINGTGGCECLGQYPFGDPDTQEGCWNCDPPCDINAKCISKDKCICNDGFIGDGLDICEKPIPILKKFHPKFGLIKGGEKIIFEIISPENYIVQKAYCRFGPVIIDSIKFNSSYIECITRKNKPGFVPLSVSFDPNLWSHEKFLFEFKNNNYNQFKIFILILIISFSLILLLLFIFFYKKKKNLII